jgi:hypothetical protein
MSPLTARQIALVITPRLLDTQAQGDEGEDMEVDTVAAEEEEE